MSLPVSQYEALLAEVRGLRRNVQRVQQLADPFILESNFPISAHNTQLSLQNIQNDRLNDYPLDYTMETLGLERQNGKSTSSNNGDGIAGSSAEEDATGSEDECRNIRGTHLSVSSEPILHKNHGVAGLYHGTWPVEKPMWNSEPIDLDPQAPRQSNNLHDVNSVMSFASSAGGIPLERVLDSPDRSRRSSQQLEAKVDMVYSLLAVLGNQEHADMGETLLALSTNPESCLSMRQSGCIPLLVQLVQSDRDLDTRKKASQALHNLVHSQPDEKIRKREIRIFRLLEHARAYTEALRNDLDFHPNLTSSEGEIDKHPVQTVAHLMKLSFDEGHRQAICQLGGIHVIASLVEVEHVKHWSTTDESQCILLRRYACMALTNLTFGDSGNKALLCSYRDFMRALVVQLQSPSDELRQVTASVLRNLSWRADSTSKDILREVGSVTGLMKAAMLDNKENTLKSILSALWNLSAHCTENKSEICAVEGALGFLVKMLVYETATKSLAIIENSGGILRNISSQIAVREDYREMLRQHNCLQVLLDQLKSPSLTIVSNACGTLWNLSAKCAKDQEALCRLGAPAMLRSLNYSKHKMIAMGSTAALKNLLSSKPAQTLGSIMDATSSGLDLPELPTLGARKQKALLQDLDQNLTETYENIEKESPVKQTHTSMFSQKFCPKTDQDYIPDGLSKQDNLTNKFSSLTLNEPSTSYAAELRSHSQMQSQGSSSLPYMSLHANPLSMASLSYLTAKSKHNQSYEDGLDVTNQPVDYSQKISEKNDAKTKSSSVKQKNEYCYNSNKSGSQTFGMYAETDLDQPTDYSLKYAEDDSDSDICTKLPKNESNEFVQDTLKTYCTEDTPYETPFNFSTATSMSDLRIDNDKSIENKTSSKEMTHLDEKDHCSAEDVSDNESRARRADLKHKVEFASGMMSPEKPVNYCEEGTPCSFSRENSFSSWNQTMDSEPGKSEPPKELNTSSESGEEKILQKPVAESRAVKFEEAVSFVQETPLMFSRSSSLGSLESAEQNFYPDDRSSVISDFSRLTSGIISPSELPDSPFQTVPQSPRPRTNPLEYGSSKPTTLRQSQVAPKESSKPSVFEDDIKKFKDEGTPIGFSTATSLSNLTIDDEAPPQISQVSEDEDDEDILAACINSGMQNNRYCQKKSTSKLPVSGYKSHQRYSDTADNPSASRQTSSIPRSSPRKIPPANNTRSKMQSDNGNCLTTYCTEDTPAALSHAGSNSNLSTLSIPESDVKMNKSNYSSPMLVPKNNTRPKKQTENGDILTTYCTEDTPAILSHAGSNSNLSILSIPDSDAKTNISSDDSNSSEENANLLAECIQSAMPKAKPRNQDATATMTSRQLLGSPIQKLHTTTPIKRNTRSQLNEAHKGNESTPGTSNSNPVLIERSSMRGASASPVLQRRVEGYELDGRQFGNTAQDDGRRSADFPDGQESSLEYSPKTDSRINGDPNVSEESILDKNESSHNDSSSSLESGVSEADLALLEQCISAGMQKSKENGRKAMDLSDADKALLEECIYSAMPKSKRKDKDPDISDTRGSAVPIVYQCSESKQSNGKPKNVNVPSAAGSITQVTSNVCPETTPAVVGVEENQNVDIQNKLPCERTGTPSNAPQAKCSVSEEKSSLDAVRNGSESSLLKFSNELLQLVSPEYSYLTSSGTYIVKDDLEIGGCLTKSCEDSAGLVDNRMLDPEAMIESLDRFTAELVSQAFHLNKEDRFKTSGSDNTWNEDTSPNELTFPSISGSAPNVITFPSETDDSSNNRMPEDEMDGLREPDACNEPECSNDFSSINTTTMTESTLIAMEATKMATAFQKEAEMSQSITSAISLELDQVQPPSQLNSISNSLEQAIKERALRSPKLNSRKKLNGSGLMVKRALSNSSSQHLSNSLNHSLESLEGNSLFNLDSMNPPSALGDVLDMENSMCSITSLPHENAEIKTDFIVNELTSSPPKPLHNPIFNVKQPAHYVGSCNLNSFSDLDHINPPSLLNEITDMCNSLADINTETICSETEIFEECFTHIPDTKTEDDATEFSDANSITPIQSDIGSSSNESTPKRSRGVNRQMTSKQRRAFAKERYKTYTVAAEMVMKEEIMKQTDQTSDTSSATEEFKTVDDTMQSYKTPESNNSLTYVSPTYSIKEPGSGKLTPREKRQMDRFRFQTQVLDEAVTSALRTAVAARSVSQGTPDNASDQDQSPQSSSNQSPARTRSSIRQNFIQKRTENKDRFKTQTLDESNFSPVMIPGSPPAAAYEDADLHLQLQKEANLVLKTLRETKTGEELLDSETLSLVSNDDDSENNSVSSVGYRTYHKSWGLRKNSSLAAASNVKQYSREVSGSNNNLPTELSHEVATENRNEEEGNLSNKPKITKPDEKIEPIENAQNEEECVKAVRGRRKPLYSKSPISKLAPKAIKPIKTLTSNLVKNVTSTVKSGARFRSAVNQKQTKVAAKPPVPQQSKASSGYGSKPVSKGNSPKTSPARNYIAKTSPKRTASNSSSKSNTPTTGTPPFERQGTFTKDEMKSLAKDEIKPAATKSRIPTSSVSKIPTSKVPKALPTLSKIPQKPSTAAPKVAPSRANQIKSASSDRANKNLRVYNRSTSADSRMDTRKIHASVSSQSLKNENTKPTVNSMLKKPSANTSTRSNSNTSLNSNASSTTKKQVTSKIASLWKKIEESKKSAPKVDSRVWIKPDSTDGDPKIVRSNTFDNKDMVILRDKNVQEGETSTKRLSRLGSFIVMDEVNDSLQEEAMNASS